MLFQLERYHVPVLVNPYIRYGQGVDKYMELINLASDIGVIQKGGAWYTITINDEKVNWEDGSGTFLTNHKDRVFKKFCGSRETVVNVFLPARGNDKSAKFGISSSSKFIPSPILSDSTSTSSE